MGLTSPNLRSKTDFDFLYWRVLTSFPLTGFNVSFPHGCIYTPYRFLDSQESFNVSFPYGTSDGFYIYYWWILTNLLFGLYDFSFSVFTSLLTVNRRVISTDFYVFTDGDWRVISTDLATFLSTFNVISDGFWSLFLDSLTSRSLAVLIDGFYILSDGFVLQSLLPDFYHLVWWVLTSSSLTAG